MYGNVRSMTDKQVFRLTDSSKTRAAIIEAILNAPVGRIVEIKPETRKLVQNSQQWPILNAFAEQVQWPINGSMVYMSPDDWKDVLTAAYKNETVRIAQGFDGGVVMLGFRTRDFSAEEWPNWMAFLNWAAAEKGVKVRASKRYEEMGEA
jgi:hypothetical protein